MSDARDALAEALERIQNEADLRVILGAIRAQAEGGTVPREPIVCVGGTTRCPDPRCANGCILAASRRVIDLWQAMWDAAPRASLISDAAARAQAERGAVAEGGTVPREYASPQEYAARNPLGGIARCFDVMADRLRAGESYESVIDDYGLCDAAPPSASEGKPEPFDAKAAAAARLRASCADKHIPMPTPMTQPAHAAAPEIQTHDSDLAIIGDPAAMLEQERAAMGLAPADPHADAELIALPGERDADRD